MLVAKGYPDIGWNPVEGERYLDFLRFAVFCNGNPFSSTHSPPTQKTSCDDFGTFMLACVLISFRINLVIQIVWSFYRIWLDYLYLTIVFQGIFVSHSLYIFRESIHGIYHFSDIR